MTLRRSLFFLVWGTLIFAALNGGGGPFASHVVLTFAVTMAVLLVSFRARIFVHEKTEFAPRFLWLHGSYALFCVTVFLSIIFGTTPQYGLSELLLFFDGGVLLFLFSGLSYTKKDLDFFLAGTLGLVSAVSLAGVFFYITSPISRLAGTFFAAGALQQAAFNTYANVLVLVLPASFYVALRSEHSKQVTRLAIATGAFLLACLLLSFSRAAYLGLVTMVVPFLILIKGREHPRAVILRVIALLLITVSLFSIVQLSRGIYFRTTSLLDKLTFSADEGLNSATERLDYWTAAVGMMRAHPLLGAGVLSFREQYPRYQEKFGINEDHPHNIFLKVGVENGVFALAFLTFFVFSVGILVVRALSVKRDNPLEISLVLGSCAALVHNLLDFNFVVSNYLLLMIFIGIFLRSLSLTAHSEANKKRLQKGLFALSLCGVMVSAFVLHEAYYNRDLKAVRTLVARHEVTHEVEVHIARARNLFFERDLDAVVSAYESEKNPVKMIFTEAEFTALKKQKCDTLQKDPQNNLTYYYDVIRLQKMWSEKNKVPFNSKSANDVILACGGRDLVSLMNEYKEILSTNGHFAVATQDPAAAAKIIELVGNPEQLRSFKALWDSKIEEWQLLNSL